MSNRHIVDRALPERANLTFYFPYPSEGSEYYVVNLPFFENVVIRENKRARYQKYSLISRSSNLYSYLGADSRKFSLSFNMTLPHILEEHPDINLDTYLNLDQDKSNLEAEKIKFLNPNKNDPTSKGMAFNLGTKYTKDLATDTAKVVLSNAATLRYYLGKDEMGIHFLQSRYGISEKDMLGINTTANFFNNMQDSPIVVNSLANTIAALVDAQETAQEDAKKDIENNQELQLRYRIIDIIIYWTNIIRASVVNYANNPIYGPPIIRLNHGILYQHIPCICTDYSIDYNEAAGYDINTLLPRQLQINMKLEEIRTGDFGEFKPGDVVKRDNLAGWEAVVTGESHSMDPTSTEYWSIW